jgi:hypothetical protein
VEDFHVPPGHIAATLDFAPRPPSTVVIDATKLVDVLNRLDLAFAGVSYSSVLAMFGRDFHKLKHGKAMPGFELVPFWLAFRYPTGAEAVSRAVSDDLRRSGAAHVTIHAGIECGVAIAVAAGFVDLEKPLTASQKTGAGAAMVERPGMARDRFQ